MKPPTLKQIREAYEIRMLRIKALKEELLFLAMLGGMLFSGYSALDKLGILERIGFSTPVVETEISSNIKPTVKEEVSPKKKHKRVTSRSELVSNKILKTRTEFELEMPVSERHYVIYRSKYSSWGWLYSSLFIILVYFSIVGCITLIKKHFSRRKDD